MVDSSAPSESRGDLLRTPIADLPGMSKRRAALFARLDVRQVADLIRHLPHRWEYHAGHMRVADLPLETIATVRGEIATCRWVAGRGGRGRGRFEATLDDESGTLALVWFNGGYLRNKLAPGMIVEVTAKVVDFNGYPQMVNPKFINLTTEAPSPDSDERYRPVYPATDGLSSEVIESTIDAILDDALAEIEDHLSPAFRSERALPELAAAYRMIHRPDHADEVKIARRRLAYDELLLLQLGFACKRAQNEQFRRAPIIRWSAAIDQHIRERFPFALTDAQNGVVKAIASDLQREVPMNRLLQGDVGSGKTVVALYAMLMAVASNMQAGLMAPTELLAEQHYTSISQMLDGSAVRIALLTGSLDREQRQSTITAIAEGQVDLVIGTHSLLTEKVRFQNLALVVIDEQHRFGVMQRATFRDKTGAESPTVPHTLVMTATPIPRTLSLTIFGDLDVSVINQLPPGRQPIATRVMPEDRRDEVYSYLADRIRERGEQAYIVLPAIDESDAGLRAVSTEARQLADNQLAGLRIDVMHGRLDRQEREAIMQRFRSGEIDVLIATTVIEVGVDVPNAAIMVVEHAERFGLAQLHQLRGRVGRGSAKSLCVYVADPTTEDGHARMQAIASTSDGFKIAEADLEIRGMGEFFGTRQAGLPPLLVAKIPDDMDLLLLARRDAQAIVSDDPALHHTDHTLLRKRLVKQYGNLIGLADVG